MPQTLQDSLQVSCSEPFNKTFKELKLLYQVIVFASSVLHLKDLFKLLIEVN